MTRLELSQLELEPRHLKMLQALLAQWIPQAEVWAYGSRVNGGAHECSDLDLVLRNPLNLKQPVEGWEELIEALQNSLLPMLVETHQWAYLPPEFHRTIEAGYIVLQESQPA